VVVPTSTKLRQRKPFKTNKILNNSKIFQQDKVKHTTQMISKTARIPIKNEVVITVVVTAIAEETETIKEVTEVMDTKHTDLIPGIEVEVAAEAAAGAGAAAAVAHLLLHQRAEGPVVRAPGRPRREAPGRERGRQAARHGGGRGSECGPKLRVAQGALDPLLLHDEAAAVRENAAWAIDEGGPEAVLQALPELKHLLQDAVASVRGSATLAIWGGGPEAVRYALPELKHLMQDKWVFIRRDAALAIAAMLASASAL